MPPKAKCTREAVAAAAFAMIKEEGISSLTARELGKRLGTSSTPIFTFFQNMEEVKSAARELAMREFLDYISDYRQYTPAFKRIGMMLVDYGIRQPELFKLLFMQEQQEPRDIRSTLLELGDLTVTCCELLQRDYKLSPEEAEFFFEQMWTQAFGLGAMCAMKVCTPTEEEIGRRLAMMFAGHMMLMKSGKMQEIFSDVSQNSDGMFHGRPVQELPFAVPSMQGHQEGQQQ